jgi:PAS domain S-box-containing protein
MTLEQAPGRGEERSLAAPEERLRIAKDAARLGIHEYRPLSGEVIWDERVRELWGVGPDDPITYELFMAGLHPDDRATTQASVDAALDPAGPGTYRAEYRVISRADGRTRWVAATGSVRFEAGHPVRLVGTVQDVSDRKRIERELRESEARFRSMADGTPVMIWVTDADGRIEYVNRAYEEFFGVTLEIVRSDGWRILIHPEDESAYVTAFATALSEQAPYHAQARVKRADGAWRWIESWGAPRRDEDGTFLGIAGSSPDVTERREAEDRLREALAAKDEFLGFVSHELRTPLTVIIGMSELLTQGQAPPDRQRELIDDILASALELDDLVDSLLVLARLGRSGERIPREPVMLHRLVEAAVERQRSRDRSHDYGLDIRSTETIVQADPGLIERVLANLLGNAAKYSPGGRPIRAVVDAGQGEVRVVIEDAGDGLDDADVERLFEPFYRSPTHRRGASGAGIGLTVCKRVVETQDGRIWARSRASGGAEFGFALPGGEGR